MTVIRLRFAIYISGSISQDAWNDINAHPRNSLPIHLLYCTVRKNSLNLTIQTLMGKMVRFISFLCARQNMKSEDQAVHWDM